MLCVCGDQTFQSQRTVEFLSGCQFVDTDPDLNTWVELSKINRPYRQDYCQASKCTIFKHCYKNTLNTVKEHPVIMEPVHLSLSTESMREYTKNRDWG
jgi:hypothetical protein